MFGMNTILHIRKSLGVSQVELARAVGRTQGAIYFYESGTTVIPPDVARKLIEFASSRDLHLTFDDIYGAA